MVTTNDDGQEIAFKFGKKDKSETTESSNRDEHVNVSDDNSSSVSTSQSSSHTNTENMTSNIDSMTNMTSIEESNKAKVMNALDNADVPNRPIKLNLDTTTSSESKPKKIKLNIKQSNNN